MNTSSAASRWSVVAAFTVVGAATQIVWLTYAPVTTVAAEHFGVSENAVGWLANLFPLFYRSCGRSASSSSSPSARSSP